MKKILALILALAMCMSLCSCGRRNIASPGTANEETAGDAENNEADNAESSEAVSNGDYAVSNNDNATANNDINTSDDNNNSGDSSSNSNQSVGNTPNSGNTNTGAVAVAPESTEEYKFISGGASIDISYGDDMSVSEVGDGSACVAYDHCRLYVQNVTSEFDPDKDAPETFLYDYAYNKCVDLVVATFGEITQFTGEYNIAASGNEIYGYGAKMTCNSQVQVHAFIKLATLDNGEGYAVMIGICDEYNAGIFDNVEVE